MGGSWSRFRRGCRSCWWFGYGTCVRTRRPRSPRYRQGEFRLSLTYLRRRFTSGNFLGKLHATTGPASRHKMTNPRKPLMGSRGFGSLLTGGSYSVRDEATGPQEDGPVTDNGTCNIDNGRFSIRPPHAVYYRNSFFWTTSFFSDTSKVRPQNRIVNNKKCKKCLLRSCISRVTETLVFDAAGSYKEA